MIAPTEKFTYEGGYRIYADGRRVFDSPLETGRGFNYEQGNAVPGFDGTCGLVSVQNVLTMANINKTEKEIVNFARSTNSIHPDAYGKTQKICGPTGGTCPKRRQELLAHNGVSSTLETQSIDNLAAAIEQGKGVIISVDADVLWKTRSPPPPPAPHAVVVTSVTRDPQGKIIGFNITDSGNRPPEPTNFYTVNDIERAFLKYRKMNVTENRIR